MPAKITTERAFDFSVKNRLAYTLLVFADGWKLAEISLTKLMQDWQKEVKTTGRFCAPAKKVAKQYAEKAANCYLFAPVWKALNGKEKEAVEQSIFDEIMKEATN